MRRIMSANQMCGEMEAAALAAAVHGEFGGTRREVGILLQADAARIRSCNAPTLA